MSGPPADVVVFMNTGTKIVIGLLLASGGLSFRSAAQSDPAAVIDFPNSGSAPATG